MPSRLCKSSNPFLEENIEGSSCRKGCHNIPTCQSGILSCTCPELDCLFEEASASHNCGINGIWQPGGSYCGRELLCSSTNAVLNQVSQILTGEGLLSYAAKVSIDSTVLLNISMCEILESHQKVLWSCRAHPRIHGTR